MAEVSVTGINEYSDELKGIANKLKEQNSIEYQLKEIVIEGLLSIQAGENPRVIEEKLKSFLAPASRNALSTEEGGGEA